MRYSNRLFMTVVVLALPSADVFAGEYDVYLLKPDGKTEGGELILDRQQGESEDFIKMTTGGEYPAQKVVFLVLDFVPKGAATPNKDAPDIVAYRGEDQKLESGAVKAPDTFRFKNAKGIRDTLKRDQIRAIYFEHKAGPAAAAPTSAPTRAKTTVRRCQFEPVLSVRRVNLTQVEDQYALRVTASVPTQPDSAEMLPAPSAAAAVECRFDAPAHFPLRQFGSKDEVVEQEGAVIHEGMRFAASLDGSYEVSFLVSTPAMPVTLRLQLCLVDWAAHCDSLTLPAIVIEPEIDTLPNAQPSLWAVRYAGQSDGIATQLKSAGLPESEPSDCGAVYQAVVRHGTARFGSRSR